MPIVQAKCTNCGANLEVDNTKDAAVCPYCNSAYIVEKAINNYTTYVTNHNNFAGANINVVGIDAENYIKLANSALEAGNGQEAFDYAKKALEIQPESSGGWIAKMKSIQYLGTIPDTRMDEAVSYGSNAIKYASADNKETVETEVYGFYLERAITLMSIVVSTLKDTEALQRLVKQALHVGSNEVTNVAKKDEELRDKFLSLSVQAINLKLKVPEAYFASCDNAREKLVRLANLYVDACKADAVRIGIYFSYLTDDALSARESNLKLLTKSLTDTEKAQVRSNEIRTNSGREKGGCYIATAVYGSYDCPQVWTLRRFRDNTLANTWHGRLFIRTYYACSPMLVKWFGNTNWFKHFWKCRLDKMISSLQASGVQSTPYQDKVW